MLNLNASEAVIKKWDKSIAHYYALHLGGYLEDIRSVSFLIEEQPLKQQHGVLYRCEINVVPESGHVIKHVVDREDCISAIDYSFAKAKRMLHRRCRGLVLE